MAAITESLGNVCSEWILNFPPPGDEALGDSHTLRVICDLGDKKQGRRLPVSQHQAQTESHGGSQ